ncbi:bestrophin family ion channel [Lutimonas halocynthiae]|uniref:bestrophin family protein n=1 Tax=Lutimonas halocynthiae TaxID=1446477 RepID=UPI0025B6271D|nr:bestrophin family ion channel [Lutimonas halocynthiae]MDN3641295.1 bestrophin family ion channel [Lutimonas halocynthiae]
MYKQRRFPFKNVLIWTKRELIFFIIMATVFTILYELLAVKWLQVPFTPVALVGTAVAFMIGFQNNAAYDRIWEARKIWGGIVNTSRSLIITVKDSFYMHRVESNKDESEVIKIITNRHIAWLTALRYAMRTKKPWEASYESMHKKEKFTYQVPEHESPLEDEIKPYLSKVEYEKVMAAANKPNAIISLQSKHLRTLTDEKKIWDFSLLNLQQMLQELTSLQGKSERIKNFPYPKQYASIGYHFVHIFMWLIPMAIIPAFSRIGLEIADVNPFVGTYFVWLNIPFTVVVIWVFNTMLRIGLAGENPFEGSPNDVPISNIARGITRDILQIIDEDPKDIPEPFTNTNYIDM